MTCKKCGTALPSGSKTCPNCGAAAGAKKLSTGWTIAISVTLILIVIAVFAIILIKDRSNRSGNPPTPPSATGESSTTPTNPSDSETSSNPDIAVDPVTKADGSYTVSASATTDEMLSRVIATYGSRELTNAQLAYYFWYSYSNYVNYYGDYLANYLNPSLPLDQQYYDNDSKTTWQSFFLDLALDDFKYYSSMVLAAEEADFKLPEEYDSYFTGMEESLESYATQLGYSSAEDYLHACFGAAATIDGYREFMQDYLTALTYSAQLQGTIHYSDDDVAAYYDANAEELQKYGVEKDGTHVVNVRHILIMPTDTESDSAWADAEQQANDIYETWQTNPTENYFDLLAKTYSADSSSSDGGLYENICPGDTVENFDSWCFDPDRKVGDTGIVKTEYGYHIMYFSGYGLEYWYYFSYTSMAKIAYSEMENEIIDRYELTTDYDKVILTDPVGMFAQ